MTQTTKKGCWVDTEWFSPARCEQFSSSIFIFGDNEKRYGKGGQAIIRDQDNAYGLRTKKSISEYWSDDEFDHNVACIDEDIAHIKRLTNKNIDVVFSSNPYGSGLAELDTRAPKTYTYLQTQLNINFGTNYDVH